MYRLAQHREPRTEASDVILRHAWAPSPVLGSWFSVLGSLSALIAHRRSRCTLVEIGPLRRAVVGMDLHGHPALLRRLISGQEVVPALRPHGRVVHDPAARPDD